MSGESGKVDLLLTKETAGVRWADLGKGLRGNNSVKLHKERGTVWHLFVAENAQNILHQLRL